MGAAAVKFSVKLSGFDGLDRALAELAPRVARNVANRSLRAGAKVIQAEAKAQLRDSSETGALARSVKVRTRRSRSAQQRVVSVGVAGTEGPLAHIIEFGSSPHTIEAPPGKVLADKKTGRVFGKKVSHPGTPPRPFLRVAADVKAAEALQTIGRVLGDGIEVEAAKLRSTK